MLRSELGRKLYQISRTIIYRKLSTMSNDNSITCHIKRSDRPCLICSGYMDLIEARPKKFNLFGGIPLVCSSEGIDCLDCPKCEFKTTTADYQYLRMCKSDRQGKGMFINSTMNSHSKRRDSEQTRRRHSGHRREISIGRSTSFSNVRMCSSCQAPLESSSWRFCPTCGNKCSSPTPATSSSRTPDCINETIIPQTTPNDIMITDINSVSNDDSDHDNHNPEKSIDFKSIENGIVRMVTPPKRKSINTDYLGPVEMQY